MNKNSNTYIITYATIMVVVVAAILSYAAISLKPLQQANIRIEKMGAILGSIGQGKGAETSPLGKDKYVEQEYQKFIVSSFGVNAQGEKVEGMDEAAVFKTLDNLKAIFADKETMPVFEAKLADGLKLYILPIYGAGLWGPVWGYIALKEDCNTVYGALFDHKGETPGLGAEISTKAFADQFVGKQLFKDGKFESIQLVKGGTEKENPYGVDAITGGTLTSNGVSSMIRNCLSDYVPFFNRIQEQAATPTQDMSLSAPEGLVISDSIATVDVASDQAQDAIK